MCQTNAFVVKDGSEEMVMESVSRLEVDGDTLRLVGIFGERREIAGRIREINFQGGKLMIEEA